MEEWEKLERRERSMIQLCLVDLVLLNVSGEDLAKKLWDKLGSLYQSKSLVNKLFLINKLYLLRMSEGILVTEHLNVFNTIIIQLSSVDITITKEEKCKSEPEEIVQTENNLEKVWFEIRNEEDDSGDLTELEGEVEQLTMVVKR
jgi:hypothetical protein